MDITMMHMMPQTTLLLEGIAGAAAIGCGGFFMHSNGMLAIAARGAAGTRLCGIAVLMSKIQGIGGYTQAPLFAVVDGIGAPGRRKLRS